MKKMNKEFEQQPMHLDQILAGSIAWEPEPNITTWELAKALPTIITVYSGKAGAQMSSTYMLGLLPETVKRHFKFTREPL